jgi:hypothetical protein
VTLLTVNSQYGDKALAGMDIEVRDSISTKLVKKGASYTPCTFRLMAGQTYDVYADSWNQYVFSAWSDGSTGNPHEVTMGTQNITLTAMYGVPTVASTTHTVVAVADTGSGSDKAATAGSAPAAPIGLIAPLYSYPGPLWTALAAAKLALPAVPVCAIINPASGPGTAQDEAYLAAVLSLQAADIMTIGYIATGYGNVSFTSIESQLAKYKAWYPGCSGIFFDEMSNVSGLEPYYAAATKAAHAAGFSLVFGNPGTSTLQSFIGTVDCLMIYESPNLPLISYLSAASMGQKGFAAIAYAVAALPAQSYITSAAKYVSWLWVTDDKSPTNPYNTLPSYLDAEMALLAAAVNV